jgi:hypothetical protein
MMNRWHALFVATVLLVAPCRVLPEEGNCTQRDNSSRPDCPGAITFLSKLQTTFQSNDRNAVASLVRYPLLTTLHSKKVHITSRGHLLTHYDEIFNAGVRCAVLNATAKEVWGNWQGFTIGSGTIWFDGIIPRTEKVKTDAPDYWTKHSFKIVAVNNGTVTIPCKSQ